MMICRKYVDPLLSRCDSASAYYKTVCVHKQTHTRIHTHTHTYIYTQKHTASSTRPMQICARGRRFESQAIGNLNWRDSDSNGQRSVKGLTLQSVPFGGPLNTYTASYYLLRPSGSAFSMA